MKSLGPRPFPDPRQVEEHGAFWPAPEVEAWVLGTFIAPGAPLGNPDHAHLQHADLGIMWSSHVWTRGNARVLGTAELGQTLPGRMGGWPKERTHRALQLLLDCGDLPDFLLTFDARWAQQATHAEWCALVEHELYHCGHATDEYGSPKWRRNGTPVWAIRRHDVEEFVGVVARYGAGAAGYEVQAMVDAANRGPEVSAASLGRGCGLCLMA